MKVFHNLTRLLFSGPTSAPVIKRFLLQSKYIFKITKAWFAS